MIKNKENIKKRKKKNRLKIIINGTTNEAKDVPQTLTIGKMKLDVFYKEKCIPAFKDIEVDTYFLHLFHSWYSTIYIDKTNDNLRQLIIFEESKTFFFLLKC